MKFNIIKVVGTDEVELTPYPNGVSTVPMGKSRLIYLMVLTNTATTSNTLTVNIYKDATLETSMNFIVQASSTLQIISKEDSPLLVVPQGRTLKAVAGASSIYVLITGEDI